MSTPRQQRVTELLTALFDYDEKNLSSFSNSVQRANELEYPIPGERGMQLENMRFILSNRDSLLESVPQASEQILTYMEKDLLSTLQYVGYTSANPYMIENLRSMTASDEQSTYLYFNAMLKEEALRRLDENRAELETIRKSYCDELDAQRWARLRETRARYDSLEDKIIEIADDNTKLEPIDESTPERFAKTWAAHKDGIARLDAVKQERSNIVRSMPEITYLPRNYQRKENEQLTSKLSKGFEWVSVAQEQVRQSILDDTMNLWEITPVVVSVLERMKPNARELAAIERKMESDRKRKKRFKIGTMALSTAATIACFFLSGGAATALQLAAKAGAVTVATAGGIALSSDALALSLENERMVYASMYGKENGTFTDKDILSAKNSTRASAFFFALSIMGASEAVRAWKLLSKFNNLIAPVQDGLASMKNGRALLESLSPNELSRLSQFRSDDVIYSLMDNMKNGKIGGGITLDEYINIRQQGAKSVEVVVDAAGNVGTRLFPGGGLAAQEAAGGHLLGKHVGQSAEALAQRLVNEPRIGAASTFLSRAEAETAMSGLYDANAARISSWVSGGANGRLTIPGSFNGGAVLPRGAASTSPGTGAIGVLQGNGNGGWYLLTGYPTIP